MATQSEPRTLDSVVTTLSTVTGLFCETLVSSICASLGIDKLINELISIKKTMASLQYTLEETAVRRSLYLSQLEGQPYRSQPFQLYTGQQFALRRHASEPDLKTATARNFTPTEPFNITVIALKANGPDYYSARAQYDTQSDFHLVSERLVERLHMSQHRQAVSGDRWCWGLGGEPVQLTHWIKLSWYVSSDMRIRDDVFFVVPNERFDVMFGRHFIQRHGDLAFAVPKVLAITSYESRANARKRKAEEEQVRHAQTAESRRRELEILSEHNGDQENDQEYQPADLSPSNEAISQAGTWTEPSITLHSRPTPVDNTLLSPIPANRIHHYATSIPMSRENSGNTGQILNVDTSIGAGQDSNEDGRHPSLLGYRDNNFAVPAHGGQRPPAGDDSTVISSAIMSNQQSTDAQSHISYSNTDITAPSTGPDGHSGADPSRVEDHDRLEDTADHEAGHGMPASSQPQLASQTSTVATTGMLDRRRKPGIRVRMMKRIGLQSRTTASAPQVTCL